ncbi:MAG: hypothetical protein M1337_01420 [Actinobacteria bacterium]|nr:hypothetical protein [Actinomycetota bacterium]
MTRYRRTSLLIIIPVVLLIIALLVPAIGLAKPGNGAVHKIYTSPNGATYNAIYHPQTGHLTVTGAIYPKSGPLK